MSTILPHMVCAKCEFRMQFETGTVINYKLECGPMPNVMAALPNIDGALCSTTQSLADAYYLLPCNNAAEMRNPLN